MTHRLPQSALAAAVLALADADAVRESIEQPKTREAVPCLAPRCLRLPANWPGTRRASRPRRPRGRQALSPTRLAITAPARVSFAACFLTLVPTRGITRCSPLGRTLCLGLSADAAVESILWVHVNDCGRAWLCKSLRLIDMPAGGTQNAVLRRRMSTLSLPPWALCRLLAAIVVCRKGLARTLPTTIPPIHPIHKNRGRT